MSVRVGNTVVSPLRSGGGNATWGTIGGTLSDQTDLNTTLISKENISNKVTSISSSSTDTQYPSAKCVYDMIGDVENILIRLTTGGGVS